MDLDQLALVLDNRTPINHCEVDRHWTM